MKRYITTIMIISAFALQTLAQTTTARQEGKCGTDVRWTFDGFTLSIINVNTQRLIMPMEDYDLKENVAPWVKRKLNVRKVIIGTGISQVGSCAFANLKNLGDVVFEGTMLKEIRWGAFYNCQRLRNISLPVYLQNIR